MAHKKTAAQHQKNGTYRKDRVDRYLDSSGNLNELPPAPIPLPDEAAKVYTEEGGRLVSMGILRPENVRLLAIYASEVGVYVEQMAEAQIGGIVVELPNGISTSSAHRKAAESALKNATALADKLGVSIIGRSRLGIRVEARPVGRSGSILDLIKGGRANDPDPLERFLEN